MFMYEQEEKEKLEKEEEDDRSIVAHENIK